MKRTIPLSDLIDYLKTLPEETSLTIPTTTPVKATGIVFQHRNGAKSIVDIDIPGSEKKENEH